MKTYQQIMQRLALLALFSALSAQLATAHAGGTNPAFSDANWVSLGNLPARTKRLM